MIEAGTKAMLAGFARLEWYEAEGKQADKFVTDIYAAMEAARQGPS
jgi:hypothetical protein